MHSLISRLGFVVVLMTALALTGCGYKGPLTLPAPPAVSDTDPNP